MKLVEYKIQFFFFALLFTFVFSQSVQASCEFGSFVNSLGKCMECLSSCPTCTSLNFICKKCTDRMKMSKNNHCISCNIGQKSCEEGNFQCMKFYTKENGQCKPECTVKNCKKCTSTTSMVCENCLAGFNLSADKKQCISNRRILEVTNEKIMENSTGSIHEVQSKNFTQQSPNNASVTIDQKSINNSSLTTMESAPNSTNNINQSMKSGLNSTIIAIPETAKNRSSSDSQKLNTPITQNPIPKITQDNSSSIHTNSTSQISNLTSTPQISSLASVNHTAPSPSLPSTPQINSSANTNQTKAQTNSVSQIPELNSNQTKSNMSVTKNSTSQSHTLDTNSSLSINHTNLPTTLPTTITQQTNSSVRQNQTILNSSINQTSVPAQANPPIMLNSSNSSNSSSSSTIINSTSSLKDCGKDRLIIGDKCQKCNLKCGQCINTPNQCLQCSQGYRKLGWKCIRTESIKFIIELEKKRNQSEINQDIYNVTKEIVSDSLPQQYEKNMSSVTLQDLKLTPMLINISGYIDCKLKNCSLPVLQRHINNYLEQKKSLNSLNINSFQLLQNVNGNDSQPMSKVYSVQTTKQIESPKQPPQQIKNNTVAIVLPIVLGLLFLGLIGCFICYYYKKCCFKAKTQQTSYAYNQDGGRVDTQRHLQRNRKTPTEVELDGIPDYVNKQRNSIQRQADEKIQQFRNLESDI